MSKALDEKAKVSHSGGLITLLLPSSQRKPSYPTQSNALASSLDSIRKSLFVPKPSRPQIHILLIQDNLLLDHNLQSLQKPLMHSKNTIKRFSCEPGGSPHPILNTPNVFFSYLVDHDARRGMCGTVRVTIGISCETFVRRGMPVLCWNMHLDDQDFDL